MSDFNEGLGLTGLHPPQIVAFLQGLARRLHQRLEELDADGSARPPGTDDNILEIADQLETAIDRVQSVGYAADTALPDHTPAELTEDSTDASRIVAAAANELAQRTAGVPNQGWVDHPDLLETLRTTCANVSETLRRIGETPA